MVWRRRYLLLLALAIAMPAQEPESEPSNEGPYEFVSGTITDLPPGKIVVTRPVPGKPNETRTFTITPETKVEGTLRTQARVTVGFKTSEEGEPVAVRIIVRPQTQQKKPQRA